MGHLGWIPGWGRAPGKRKWQPTPVFLPGESHGQSILAGYSPWGCRESDVTERLTLSTKTFVDQPYFNLKTVYIYIYIYIYVETVQYFIQNASTVLLLYSEIMFCFEWLRASYSLWNNGDNFYISKQGHWNRQNLAVLFQPQTFYDFTSSWHFHWPSHWSR